jgi:hypothetical protein
VSAAQGVERVEALGELAGAASEVDVVVTGLEDVGEDGRQVTEPVGAASGHSELGVTEEGSAPDHAGECADGAVEAPTVTGEVTVEGREVEATRSGRGPALEGAGQEAALPVGEPEGVEPPKRATVEGLVGEVEQFERGGRVELVETDQDLEGGALCRGGVSGSGGDVDGVDAEYGCGLVDDDGVSEVEGFGEQVGHG